MKLSDLGEFGLIDLISRANARYDDPRGTSRPEVVAGIGDDAAAWQGGNRIQLATTDTLVQDVHFNLDIISWDELGWKALAVNLSDIAAMGGIPDYALLSLALPAHLEVDGISEFVDSLMRTAREFAVAIVGGNIATAPNVIITVTMLGHTKDKAMLRRSTASPGEQIAVTGYVGSSAAGLEMIKGKPIPDSETAILLRRAHFRPMPRVEEGQALIDRGVRTAIDISDGLVADLDHMCQASDVSAEIRVEQVPVHPVVRANFSNYQGLALHGGEDYELLFTADEATISQARQAMVCPVTVIGSITGEESATRVTLLDNRGHIIPYKKGGWEHFKNGGPQIGFSES